MYVNNIFTFSKKIQLKVFTWSVIFKVFIIGIEIMSHSFLNHVMSCCPFVKDGGGTRPLELWFDNHDQR